MASSYGQQLRHATASGTARHRNGHGTPQQTPRHATAYATERHGIGHRTPPQAQGHTAEKRCVVER